MHGAARRFPFVSDAEIVKLVCHPDAMTPDANPLLGPIPGVHGFFMAAGLSLNGFGGAGGIGKTIAEWVTAGETELDVLPYRAWRFGNVYRDPSWAAEIARETYRYYYELRYPFDRTSAGRPRRGEPVDVAGCRKPASCSARRTDGNARSTSQPGEAVAPSRAPTSAPGDGPKPPFNARVGEEHRAVRERVGLIRHDVVREDRGRRAGRARHPRARVRTTASTGRSGASSTRSSSNARGGIVADVTVTRLAEDRFRVITGSGTSTPTSDGSDRTCRMDGTSTSATPRRNWR